MGAVGDPFPQAMGWIDTRVAGKGRELLSGLLPVTLFPDIYPEILIASPMPQSKPKSLSAYRRRLKQRGVVRVEVHVHKNDAALVRSVARALSDPAVETEARVLLRERFGVAKAKGLKEFLASAPLEGLDLTRKRDVGRKVEL